MTSIPPPSSRPGSDRMVDPGGRPFVAGVVPVQPELVVRTAALWAGAAGASSLYCAYADPGRVTEEEFADGTVRHAAIDPDADYGWQEVARDLESALHTLLDDAGVPWSFRFLAGRPDRALTHLARAVDASVFVVGGRRPGAAHRMREFVEGSVAVHLAQHQHRPVLVVPVRVVDWKERPWG